MSIPDNDYQNIIVNFSADINILLYNIFTLSLDSLKIHSKKQIIY